MQIHLCRNNPVITTTKGDVRGRAIPLTNGMRVYAFEGIPYAQAPVGQLRWQNAQPAAPWQETRDATRPGAMCMQQDEQTALARPNAQIVRPVNPQATPQPQFPPTLPPTQNPFGQVDTNPNNPVRLPNSDQIMDLGLFPVQGGTDGPQPQFQFQPRPGVSNKSLKLNLSSNLGPIPPIRRGFSVGALQCRQHE